MNKVSLHNLINACFDLIKSIQTLGYYCLKQLKYLYVQYLHLNFRSLQKSDRFYILLVSSSHLLEENPYLVMQNFWNVKH